MHGCGAFNINDSIFAIAFVSLAGFITGPSISRTAKGGFPLSRNFYVPTYVNFKCLYARKQNRDDV